MNQSAAEILIHLGVGARIVETGYEIDKVPEEIAAEYDKIPMLSAHGQEIKHEALLEAQPDFQGHAVGGSRANGDRVHPEPTQCSTTCWPCVRPAVISEDSTYVLR
jgi:hypothetical protein